ncbi:MAG: hypothetical protein WBP18_20310 [Paracoccaceae bacterium]
MVRPLPGDVILFARVLSALPKADRAQAARGILAETAAADRHCRALGRSHPQFGDGSLAARLMRAEIPPLTHADDPEFLHALRIVARAVLKHTAF